MLILLSFHTILQYAYVHKGVFVISIIKVIFIKMYFFNKLNLDR